MSLTGTGPEETGGNPSAPSDTSQDRWRRRPASRGATLTLNLVFALFGLLFVVVGYNEWAAVQPVAGGTTTAGSVVSVANGETCGRYGCSPNWTPTITFQASNGGSYTFTGPTSDNQMSVGQTVVVSYLASDPSVAHDLSASGTPGVIYLGIGVFALVFGVGSTAVGFAAVHRRTGLSSAREGNGWVGHKQLHSNQGVVAAVAVGAAIVAVGFFVI